MGIGHAAERLDDPSALAELEAAQTSTLHALAARICRDHPEAAGVPADFASREALEGDLWQAEQLDAALGRGLCSAAFLKAEWEQVVDPNGISSWEAGILHLHLHHCFCGSELGA